MSTDQPGSGASGGGQATPPDREATGPVTAPRAAQSSRAARRREAANMLPGRERRRFGLERLLIRLVATGGIVGIGVALGAILAASNVQGWIIGLVVALVSVLLAATLWSSRQL